MNRKELQDMKAKYKEKIVMKKTADFCKKTSAGEITCQML